jgi:hypothetical protein
MLTLGELGVDQPLNRRHCVQLFEVAEENFAACNDISAQQWLTISEQVCAELQIRVAPNVTLVAAVSACLFESDAMDIAVYAPVDEYAGEARFVVEHLSEARDPEQMVDIVHRAHQRFGAEIAGPREKYVDVARPLWVLCQNWIVLDEGRVQEL